MSKNTAVLSLKFLSIYIYSVTKILRKMRMITFTENYGESRERASERYFNLVLLVQPFTRSLPTRIQ